MAKPFKPRFARPSVLGTIDPPDLVPILRPFRQWLTAAGVWGSSPAQIDLNRLSAVIAAGSGPDGFVDQICAIDELAVPKLHDRVVACAQRIGLALNHEDFGHKLVVKVMAVRSARVLLEKLLTERASLRPSNFDRYMSICKSIPRMKRGSRTRLKSLEDALDSDFLNRQRQRAPGVVKGQMFKEANGFRLLVRRGDTKRSERTVDDEDGRTRSLIFRPELYDIIRYDERYGDLLVNAKSKTDTRAYCCLIGEHLFGDRFAFDPNLAPRRYTLNAIREHGLAALTFADIEGIESVRLHLLELILPGCDNTPMRFGPGDALLALQAVGGIDSTAVLVRAVFKIRIRGETRERTVGIKPPISATYDRDDAGAIIETFIERRGYLLPRSESLCGAPDTLFSLY